MLEKNTLLISSMKVLIVFDKQFPPLCNFLHVFEKAIEFCLGFYLWEASDEKWNNNIEPTKPLAATIH